MLAVSNPLKFKHVQLFLQYFECKFRGLEDLTLIMAKEVQCDPAESIQKVKKVLEEKKEHDLASVGPSGEQLEELSFEEQVQISSMIQTLSIEQKQQIMRAVRQEAPSNPQQPMFEFDFCRLSLRPQHLLQEMVQEIALKKIRQREKHRFDLLKKRMHSER